MTVVHSLPHAHSGSRVSIGIARVRAVYIGAANASGSVGGHRDQRHLKQFPLARGEG